MSLFRLKEEEETIMQKNKSTILPVYVIVFSGQDSKLPDIVIRNYTVPALNRRPFLLSPEHLDKLIELPF